MDPVLNAASRTQQAFESLLSEGWVLVGRELVLPDQFKGGFILAYAKASDRLEIRYLDLELVASRNGDELFGPTRHSQFSGNMFSPENLSTHIPSIAAEIGRELRRQWTQGE